MCIEVSSQHTEQAKEQSLNFSVYSTNDDTLVIEDVLGNSKDFRSPGSFEEKTEVDEIYWIRLHLKELGYFEDKDLFLKHNSFDYGEIYFLNKTVTKKNIGLFDQTSIGERIAYDNYYSEVKIDVDKLRGSEFLYLKIKRVTFNESIKNWNFSLSSTSHNNFSQKDIRSLVPYYIFAGICFLAWFWSLSFFLMLRKLEFLYYSLYTIILFIYVCGYKLGVYQFVFNNNYSVEYWFSQCTLFIANIIYAFYLIKYLRTKSYYPIFHLILKSIVVFNIAVIVAILVFCLNNVHVHEYLYYTYLIYFFSAIPLLLYLVFAAKNPLAYFVFFATLSLLVFSLARMYFASPEDGLYLDSFYYIIIGTSIEIIIFVFGLNYKVQRQLLERFKLKEEAYISKTKALRAQINPHFIFNSLSSIQSFITNNDSVSALKYLSKFGRLTRNILESSIEDNVVLADEIKMLKDYLELESLRFDNVFSYSINIHDDLDENSIEVPFMILQPFVENAIIHGLLPKKEGVKMLEVNFKKKDDVVICEVDDTGVGRKSGVQSGYSRTEGKKSRGIEVTKQRLESLKITTEPIKMIDKIDENGSAKGTKVIIKIPI
ncbi:sensor histidine kinase [Flagellimonas pacifica]|uniref:7TM diverse intracellular signalling n=1 Tax=Flagellimonas pacifica TaxID=1247520 RepID=A0A285N0K0_9FLAO|nr:histidine kinase [Allomuricauda parva]SNZ01546.1 7TM diverse intracellular signalling [Allomuricauda parva]